MNQLVVSLSSCWQLAMLPKQCETFLPNSSNSVALVSSNCDTFLPNSTNWVLCSPRSIESSTLLKLDMAALVSSNRITFAHCPVERIVSLCFWKRYGRTRPAFLINMKTEKILQIRNRAVVSKARIN